MTLCFFLSQCMEEHTRHLAQVFGRLRQIGLKLHPQKCHFAHSEVPYLGHVISCKGISPDPNKLRVVAKFRTPTSAKAVWEFVGLVSYYRRFVPNFARIVGPLRGLT